MKDLIAKLEAATEGSRELDVRICEEVNPGLAEEAALNDHYEAFKGAFVPNYTTSIDCALTLVPEGYGPAGQGLGDAVALVSRGSQNWAAHVDVATNIGHWSERRATGVSGPCQTPALALAIAALKARCAQ